MVYNLVQKQKMKKIILIAIAGLVLLAIIFVIAGVNIQSYIDKKQTNMIDLVKRSIPTKYQSVTLGSMLENYPYFKSYQWRDSTSARGEHFVRFIAEYNYVSKLDTSRYLDSRRMDTSRYYDGAISSISREKVYGTIAVDFVMSLPTESGDDWSICGMQVGVNCTKERYYCDKDGDTTYTHPLNKLFDWTGDYHGEGVDLFLESIYNRERLENLEGYYHYY